MGSILQKFHTEIEFRAYLKANEIRTLCNNRIVEEEERKGKAEPEETDETRTMVTSSNIAKRLIQDNYATEHQT